MPISFSQIPVNIKVPLYYVEVDPSMAGLPQLGLRALLVGTQLAIGDAAPNVPIEKITRHDDNGPMPIVAARIAQRAALGGIRWNFGKPNGCIAIEVPERALDAGRAREGAIEEG